MKPGRVVLIAVGVLLTVALMGLAFFRVTTGVEGWHLEPRFPLGDFFRHLPSHLPWVLPFMALTASLAALRAIVWGRTLPLPVAPWRSRFHAVALGGLVHNVVPGHLGPLASSWILARERGTGVPAALASLLLAKLLEFGALVVITIGLALVARGLGTEIGPLSAMLWAGVAALVIFTIALGLARRLAPRIAARLLSTGRWPRLSSALGSIGAGLVAVGSPVRLLAGWAAAGLPVMATALAYALALRHVGVDAWLLGGGLLVSALTLAQLTPGVPGTVGIYYFVCTATARSLGANDQDAAAVALLSHTATVVSHVLVGLASAARHHDRLRELLRLGRGVALPPAATAPAVSASR